MQSCCVLSEKARNILRDWLIRECPNTEVLERYDPRPEVLKDQRAQHQVRVFGGGTEPTLTIFQDRLTLVAYRAWHDTLHIQLGLGFGRDDELKLSEHLYGEGLAIGLPDADAALIRLDLKLHIQHYYRHNQHPVQQVEMIRQMQLYGRTMVEVLQEVW